MKPVTHGEEDAIRSNTLRVVAIAVVTLSTVGVVGFLKIRALLVDWAVQHQGIDVPCLYGMDVEEARNTLHDGLNLTNVSLELRVVETRPMAEVASGRVVEQDPGCKATLTRLRPVNVIVSRSPDGRAHG